MGTSLAKMARCNWQESSKLKILIFASWYYNKNNQYLGIFIREQAEALARNGHNVSVLYLDPTPEKLMPFSVANARNSGVDEYRVSLPFPLNRLISFYFPWLLKSVLKNLIDKIKPDIIHAHASRPAATILAACNISDIPVVVTEHKGAFEEYWLTSHGRKKVYSALNQANKVISVSNYLKQKILEHEELDIDVIPNGIDTELFCSSEGNKRSGYLSVSNLVPDKRVEWIIRAYSQLSKPKDLLFIVGSGPELGRLENLCRELGCVDEVIFTGALSRTELSKLMSKSKCLIHASKYETFCMVCFEALSCGMSVILSRCGGPEEFLTNEYVNYFNSCSELCDLLQMQQSAHPSYIDNFNSSKFIHDNYSLANLAAKLGAIYKDLLDNKNNLTLK